MNGIIRVLLLFFITFGFNAFSAEPAKDAKEKDKAAKEKESKSSDDPKDGDDESSSDSEVANILNSMGYPELQVVPRASERLRMEAKDERGSWFMMHWPVQLSGLATMTVGLMASSNQKDNLSASEKDDATTVGTFTTAVGAAWLAGGLILGGQKPYARGYRALSKGTPKDERATLTRERLAEEALERPARVMRVLRHVSVLTNFSMNALSAVYSNDQGKVMAGVGAILAFLPYMFEDHTVSVHEKHIEYKKKIYTPIKGASLHYDPQTRGVTPMTTLVWMF